MYIISYETRGQYYSEHLIHSHDHASITLHLKCMTSHETQELAIYCPDTRISLLQTISKTL